MNQENDLIETYHILILGALKKCHISSYHPMFEDYLQIARWLLIDTHRYFIKEGKPMDGFHNYVYQRIYWKITDEIRKELHYTEKLIIEEDNDTSEIASYLLIPETSQEDLLEVKDLLVSIEKILTDVEYQYLVEAFINELTVTQIADKYQVSRKTVYQWRKRVALKSLAFFDKQG